MARTETELILTHTGTAPTRHAVGELIVNQFDASQGLQSLTVAEHSIFLINTPTQTTDIWEGERQQPRDWSGGDVQFLPCCSALQTSVSSTVYAETMIRVPRAVIERACAEFNMLRHTGLRYMRVPPASLYGIAGSVIEAAQAPEPIPALLADALTVAMACGIAGAVTGSQHDLPGYTRGKKIKRAIDYIEAHLSQDMRLEDIASAAAMSPFHFTRAFKDAVGTTPIRHVWARRVAMSQCMMRRDPSMPLAHVALACGFANQSSFTTRFREVVGVTPDRFRRG